MTKPPLNGSERALSRRPKYMLNYVQQNTDELERLLVELVKKKGGIIN
jgi:hypothetical protein